MSSNVGLSTPRGSGTSGYVQRNSAFLKPRNAGYGAPYPPVATTEDKGGLGGSFRQRKPDQQILDHDRKRAIEVQVLEERERLEEENEELEKEKKKGLTEEEIDERCDALRVKLLKELEEGGEKSGSAAGDRGRRQQQQQQRGGQYEKDRRQLKSYQVHELAEAKIQESERLRKALGIKEDWEKKDATPAAKEKEKVERREEEDGGRDRERDERRDRRRRYP